MPLHDAPCDWPQSGCVCAAPLQARLAEPAPIERIHQVGGDWHKLACDGKCGMDFGCASQWQPNEIEKMKALADGTTVNRVVVKRLVGGDRNSPEPFTDGLRADELGKAAKKMDFGKPPVVQGFLQYFARAILAVAYVSEYGARKYAQPGKPLYSAAWQEVSDGEGRYADADGRHRVKLIWEGDYDEESELAHLAHKAWNALAELEIALKTKRIDCRIGNVIVNGKPQPGTSKKVPL